ncbi:uncharacterized protein LOC122850945 [Aphidius gifuensis]|uniref:uncharacterized protein LOC122850945 n=1 Tax=Aphidius gifuensis TaxID=684658 RepID=UPI001CDB709B|nr:uncharacterized protein LOC122850945 [Aphidius gifuensis]
MDNLKQPKLMSMDGDLALNWKKFKQAFELYLLASGGSTKDEKIQVAVSDEEKKVLKTLLDKFEAYFKPKTKPSLERLKFNIRGQARNKSFHEFLKDLKKIAASCDFGTLKDSLIKDRLVCGVKDKRIKDKLLREDDMTLEKAVTICKAAELTEKHLKDIYDQVHQ